MIRRLGIIAACVLCCLAVTLLAGAADAARTELRVHFILGASAIKYLNDNVIPEFERKFNADVSIDMATWNNRMEKLLITTAGGVPPDVYMNGAEHVLELVEMGLVAPLDKEF